MVLHGSESDAKHAEGSPSRSRFLSRASHHAACTPHLHANLLATMTFTEVRATGAKCFTRPRSRA
eukprot:226170-Amphidinium_carterae.2